MDAQNDAKRPSTERSKSPQLVEPREEPSEEFMDICHQLDPDMDAELLDKAWKQFDTVGQQYVLEGGNLSWIACALYLSMWQLTPIGHELRFQYPISKLTRICKISVLEFFDKLSRWVAMAGAARRMQEQVSRIQSSLAVSTVVYKKLLPIFRKVFASPQQSSNSPSTSSPSSKEHSEQIKSEQSSKQINCKKIFELLWTLFIAMKKQLITDDLMNSFHLLLCSVDFIFQDLRNSSSFQHLLNQDFVNLIPPDEPSALETLCRIFKDVVLDAKHFRAHWWLPKLHSLINEQKVTANAESMNEFVENVDQNIESLNEMYEKAMIRKGEMDERMFIPPDVSTVFDDAFDASAVEQLRRSAVDESWAVDAELLLRMSTQSCLERLNEHRQQQTPLSGKSYVISGELFCPATPISGALYNAQRMEQLLANYWQGPSDELERIFAQCRENPKIFILDSIRMMGNKLENAVAAERESHAALDAEDFFTETISLRRENVDRLFFRLLEKIITAERERERMITGEVPDLSIVLNKDELIASVYVCALELILFTYESELEFPWSLDVLRLAPIHFYKSIELVIRAEPELSREMVKHLNRIEERVLEELAWSVDSPLWQTLVRRADGVPSSQSVSLNAMEAYSVRTQSQYGLSQRYNQYSPMKQQSMQPSGASVIAKRRLEFEDDGGVSPVKRQAMDPEWSGAAASTSATTLFFRKVYYLAAVRLHDLCERVHLDEKSRHRVWTLFEHVLRTETSLMTGRHLDQNLMCCLYVIAKISKQDVSFHNIMYHYRHQPQASSRVYRQVLIDATPSPTMLSDDNASRDSIGSNSGGAGRLRSGSTLPIPGMGSAPPTPEPQNVDYTDLIKYYNRVFVSRVEYFVKKLQPGLVDLKESGISLLAMPTVRCHTLSPRRTIADHVSVLPMPVIPASPARPIKYSFNRSPTIELRTINRKINSVGGGGVGVGGSASYGSSPLASSYPVASTYRSSPYSAKTSFTWIS